MLDLLINKVLALDPESEKHLAVLEGKVITIQLTTWHSSFQLRVLHQKIQTSWGEQYPADMTIKGTPLSMLSLVLSRHKMQRFSRGDLTLEGDAELGQQVLDIVEKLEIDWEEHLSHLMGDVAAHEMGRFAKNIKNWGKEAGERLAQNTAEYIHEEKPWFPPEEAVQDFMREIDELRMDADRLEARVKEML